MRGFVIRGRHPPSEPVRDIFVAAAVLTGTAKQWFTFDPKEAAIFKNRARAENWMLQSGDCAEEHSLTVWPAEVLDGVTA